VDHVEAVVIIAAGAGSIVMGLRSKVFYALGPGQRPRPTTKAMPRWLGRLWCIAVGGLMIYWSLPSLSGRWRWSDLWADWWLFAFFGAPWIVSSVLNRMRASEPKSGIQTLDLEESKEATPNF
jgi:hypothetical protein